MVQGVYVDILLVINFLVDFLLLSLLARTGGRGTQGGWRRVAAAAIGSLFSLSIFLPPLPHEDLGQLNAYVGYYKKNEMTEGDNCICSPEMATRLSLLAR